MTPLNAQTQADGSSSTNIKDQVIVGPDLNSSRTPLDKKCYRQIIIKQNGLKVVLISDTLAMIHQEHFDYDSEESDSDDERDKPNDNDDGNDNDGDDDNEENSKDEEESYEDDGVRKAAAALVVGAGSFHDPSFAQGMAHFLEHMLFMGTEKYPGENQYDAFLSKNSGSDNAYTELEHTMYHMEVSQEKFFEALDMLSQFFISPLMLKDSVERELNAIESEFKLSKNSDECRLQQLLCHDCSLQGASNGDSDSDSTTKHPFAGFSWGNIESLKTIPEKNGVDMMKELRKFYNRHYYAQNMALVVIGAYSLDELEKHVVESFSNVPALPRVDNDDDGKDDEFYNSSTIQRKKAGTWDVKTHTPIQDCGMPFNQETLGRLCRIVPVKDRHSLSITWQIPPQWKNWKSKPCDFIAHLLGHEAAGSILSALKAKSWVNECYAGVGSGGYENASSHALFCLQFTLSVDGVSHWVEIVRFVYIYIGMIRHYCQSDDGLPSWIYEELRAIQQISHHYEDEPTPVDLVEDIADCLTPYNCLPPERLLDGDALLFEYDADAIKTLVDKYLTPQYARVDLMSSTFGRAGDFEDHVTKLNTEAKDYPVNSSSDDASIFDVGTAGDPLVEPIFGTRYYSHVIDSDVIKKWEEAREPRMPAKDICITLPPLNPFIPTKFDLKELPIDDSLHPLLFTSLKICVSIGKKKAWFPCTCNKYDRSKNKVLLGMEDGDEKWHFVDISFDAFDKHIAPGFEGTLDKKATKYKVISVPKDGEGATMKYGDESDWLVADGIHFPHIPPPLPKSRLPSLVVNTQILKLWYLHDRKFLRPTGEFRLRIACGNANKTPLDKACAELLTILIHDATTETSYLASVCELGNEIEATDVGFNLRIHGFDDKILDLTAAILKVFFSFKDDSEELPLAIKHHRFEACLEVLRRRYSNSGMKTSTLCSNVRLRCLRPTIWSSTAKASAIKNISVSQFLTTVTNILTKVSIESLYHGNFDKADADAAKKIILEATTGMKGMQKKHVPKQEVLIAPQNISHRIIVPSIDPKEPNTAVEVYFQCGKDSIHDRVATDLLMQLMYEPLYDQLRTKEQFGYQVSCGSRWTYGVVGLCFKVVTNCKSAEEVSVRIEKFLTEFRSDLEEMSKEVFMENVVGLANDKLQKWNSLDEEAGSFWSEIVENRYDFEVHRNEVETLKKVTKADLLAAFDKFLSAKEGTRRKLEIHAIGSEGDASCGRPKVDPDKCLGENIDEKVQYFHTLAEKTWGKIY